jgi:hypothetical protein
LSFCLNFMKSIPPFSVFLSTFLFFDKSILDSFSVFLSVFNETYSFSICIFVLLSPCHEKCSFFLSFLLYLCHEICFSLFFFCL